MSDRVDLVVGVCDEEISSSLGGAGLDSLGDPEPSWIVFSDSENENSDGVDNAMPSTTGFASVAASSAAISSLDTEQRGARAEGVFSTDELGSMPEVECGVGQ